MATREPHDRYTLSCTEEIMLDNCIFKWTFQNFSFCKPTDVFVSPVFFNTNSKFKWAVEFYHEDPVSKNTDNYYFYLKLDLNEKILGKCSFTFYNSEWDTLKELTGDLGEKVANENYGPFICPKEELEAIYTKNRAFENLRKNRHCGNRSPNDKLIIVIKIDARIDRKRHSEEHFPQPPMADWNRKLVYNNL